MKCQNVLNNFHAQHYAINTRNFVKLVHILSPISCNSKTVSKLEIHFKRLWNNWNIQRVTRANGMVATATVKFS